MKGWGWAPERNVGIWRHGAGWLHPIVAAAPWLTIALLLLMFFLIGGTLTAAKGVLFDLPERGLQDGEPTRMVALVMPTRTDTLVFFDDARYLLGDSATTARLERDIADRAAQTGASTLLALADRRVSSGDLMKFATLVRQAGVQRILFAEKREAGGVE